MFVYLYQANGETNKPQQSKAMKELAASLATFRKGFNGTVYGGVNESLHIFVKSEKVEVDESFKPLYDAAYEASMTDEAFDALLDGDVQDQYQYVLSTLN